MLIGGSSKTRREFVINSSAVGVYPPAIFSGKKGGSTGTATGTKDVPFARAAC